MSRRASTGSRRPSSGRPSPLEDASTTAESFTGTIDRTVEGVSSAADTIVSVRTNLETLESVLRAVNILGLTPLGPPAEAVGGIANAIEGLDTRLTAIADSLAGNRDSLGHERGLARPRGRQHGRDGRSPAVGRHRGRRSPMSSSWSG